MGFPHAVISIEIPYPYEYGPFERKEDFAKFMDVMDEFNELSGTISFPIYGMSDFKPLFICIEDISFLPMLDGIYQVPSGKDCVHLVFFLKALDDEQVNSSTYIDLMLKYITDLLILANICHPGMVGVGANGYLVDGEPGYPNMIPKMDNYWIQTAILNAQDLKWPQMEDLKISDAWEWYLHQEDYLIQEGFEGDICTRALNAFARLFEETHTEVPSHLVWSMIGIEALYERGKVDVMRQVRENIPQILGQYADFKKEFDRMYEFRSRFIHGDMDIPALYFFGDGNPRFEQLFWDLDRTISFSSSILIASLQHIIKGNWPTFGFPPKLRKQVPKI